MDEAVSHVEDGNMLALGGNVLHRAPMAFVRELVRKGKKNLGVIKTTGAHDVDVLCAGGCLKIVHAGFIGYETGFGSAAYYRQAVESGTVMNNEHSCYTVMCALRAAAAGAPFMPVRGLKDSDLLKYNDFFKVIEDPFGSGPIALVKALVPDVAVIHVQESDQKGNARIYGPRYDDLLMMRAARKVILTAEEIVPETRMKMQPETVDIPYFLVAAVVYSPGGALPCSCTKKYPADEKALAGFKAIKTPEQFSAYLHAYEQKDSGRRKAGSVI